jgi:hypothetical protein
VKGTGKIKAIHFAALILAVLLQGCALGETPLGEIQVDNDADIPGLCKKELKDCFGEEYTLSEGEEKEEEYYNEFKNRNMITRYTEWDLSYKDTLS